MRNQKGQLILTLIIIMTVVLAIGLSIIQKSLLDVSTSTKVEQSSRAFSAAEAGIEKYLQNTTNCDPVKNPCVVDFSSTTGSQANVQGGNLIPVTSTNTQQDPLEYPPLAKEDVVQVWLADLDSTTPSSPPACGPSISCYYVQNTLDVYWGNSDSDKAALELTLIYYGVDSSDPIDPTTPKYRTKKFYLDNPSATRSVLNHFDLGTCDKNGIPLGANKYQCRKSLTDLPAGLILVRVRLLYNSTSQPFAVAARGSCGKDCSLPQQAKVLISTGSAGDTQRKVRVFQEYKVVPPYFDYAIFSAGDIVKQ